MKKKTNRKKQSRYVAPKPKKPKLWLRAAPGLAVLRFRPTIREGKVAAIARRLKNPSVCVVAPIFAAVEEFDHWSPALVENIIQIGNELHRISLQQLKLRFNSAFPVQCVCPTFFVNRNKVSILVKPVQLEEPLNGAEIAAIDPGQLGAIDSLLAENHGLVIQCGGKTNSYWKGPKSYHSLVPEGFQSPDNYVPSLIRSGNLKTLLECSLDNEHGPCNLYAVKVLASEVVPIGIDRIDADFILPEITESDLRISGGAEKQSPEPVAAEPEKTAAAKKPPPRKKLPEPEPEFQGIHPDQIISFTDDYKPIDETRGILSANSFVSQPERLLHTVVAAAVFLSLLPANLWTSLIIKDILALGKRIFYDSEELLEKEDWTERVYLPINFARRNYLVDFEKIVFGNVVTSKPGVPTIEKGLAKFFQSSDVGMVLGPQLVLVWQMKNNFFMFDPKERDLAGRKWTRLHSAELGDTGNSGSACIMWFHSLKKLSEVYTETISLKHRQDPYRIVRLRVYEKVAKPETEENWIGLATNKWMLVGSKTLCDYSYADDPNRLGKAICIGTAALLRANEMAETDWTGDGIDSILTQGIDLFKQSFPDVEKDETFTVKHVKKLAEIGGRSLKIDIVDCLIKGQMTAEESGKSGKTGVTLQIGLKEFFNAFRYGLFTVNSIALAIWRGADNHYYVFYPYEKLFGLPPHCLCAEDASLPPMGLSNSLRFKTMDGLLDFLINWLDAKEDDQYCLHPINFAVSEASDRPPLRSFETFGESGGILRPYKDLHEGHEMFGVRADKQTLANLMTALGFNRITPSTHWTKEEMADILHIGDKLFCKVFMGLPECQARDYVLQWNDVLPMIGMNKFTYERVPIVGVLVFPPPVISEEAEEEAANEPLEDDEEMNIEPQDEVQFVPPTMDLGPPESNDLKGILKTWAEKKRKFTEGVVETDFFSIAIWKKDKLYFVFDPKASGENGEITERRFESGKDRAGSDVQNPAAPQAPTPGAAPETPAGEGEEETEADKTPLFLEKRNYNDFDNTGSAYTAWFADFDEFFDHILKKIPEDYRHDKFTLHDLTITNNLVGADDIALLKPGFRSIKSDQTILRASISLNHPSLTNGPKAEFADVLVALAFARITPSKATTTTLLDVILKYGDRLYTKSMKALKTMDKEKFCTIDKLRLEELSPIFTIYKIRFNWKVTADFKGTLSVADLKNYTGRLGTIEAGTAILLSHKNYLMAFWKSEGGFYLFDPFQTDPSAVITQHGLPSLSRFPKLDPLLNYICQKFLCVPGSSTYTGYLITIKSSAVEEVQLRTVGAEVDPETTALLSAVPKEQESFQPFEPNMSILKSPLDDGFLPEHGLALAALVHSRLQFVRLWSSNIGSRISFLCNYLLQKTECDMALEPATFMDIRRSFAIDNDVLCHIVFTKNIQGPLYTSKRTEIVGINLKNALINFFRNCQHLIVTVPGMATSFAMWKENGKFYLFGINRSNKEMYVVEAGALDPLFGPLFKNLKCETDDNNWYELRSVNVSTVPIRDGICKPLSSWLGKSCKPFYTKSQKHTYMDSQEAHFFDHVADRPELQKPPESAFIKVGNKVDILYAKGVLRSHRFHGTKDFFPSLQAACVEAAALSEVSPPRLWTKKTLERIISAGINLYINTVAVRGVANIKMVDFKGKLFIGHQECEVCPLAPTVQAASKDDLMMCLNWVLRKYRTAYFYTDNFCFTLMLDNNDIFLYHPGSMQAFCENIRSDSSCLIRYCTISEILDKLLTNGEISRCENVCIGPICVFRQI